MSHRRRSRSSGTWWTRLGHHNVVSFRTEVTTAGQGLPALERTGRQIVANLAAVRDFGWVHSAAR